MRFSVIIPVRNVEPWLDECLASLRSQTWRIWECICADDGSFDDSGERLIEALREDARFRVVFQPHGNPSRARNRALGRVRGDAIAFLDGDDAVAPWWLMEAERLLRKTKADLVRFGIPPRSPSPTIFRPPSGRHEVVRGADAILSWGWPAFYDAAYCVLSVVRREVMDGVRFPDVPFKEDLLFGFRLLPHLRVVCLSPSVHYFYRARSSSLVALPQPLAFPLSFLQALRVFPPPRHPTVRRVLAMSAFAVVVDWLVHPAAGSRHEATTLRGAWLKTVGALRLSPLGSLVPHWRIGATLFVTFGWRWPIVLHMWLLRRYGAVRARVCHG